MHLPAPTTLILLKVLSMVQVQLKPSIEALEGQLMGKIGGRVQFQCGPKAAGMSGLGFAEEEQDPGSG